MDILINMKWIKLRIRKLNEIGINGARNIIIDDRNENGTILFYFYMIRLSRLFMGLMLSFFSTIIVIVIGVDAAVATTTTTATIVYICRLKRI